MSRTGNVRVSFRLRPMNEEEQKEERYGCVKVHKDKARVSVRNDGITKHYNFDKVFDDVTTQASVYKETLAPFVADFLAGRNCSVLVYGEKGSGKTFSINGSSKKDDEQNAEHDDDLSSIGSAGVSRYNGEGGEHRAFGPAKLPNQVITGKIRHKAFSSGKYAPNTAGVIPSYQLDEDAGITQRVIHEVFDKIQKGKKAAPSRNKNEEPVIRLSYLEVSEECVIDLLGQAEEENVGKASVEHTVEKVCLRSTDAIDIFQIGQSYRAERLERIGSDSSRSHSVLVLKLERYSRSKGKRTTSSFFLVDLANSLLVHRPPLDADSLFSKESNAVRRSLGALRKCLRCAALSDRSSRPPYADSALTKLLQDGLGRGAGIALIVTANPLTRHVNETLSSIRFGVYAAGHRIDSNDDTSSRDHLSTGTTRAGPLNHGSKSPTPEKSESDTTPKTSGSRKSSIVVNDSNVKSKESSSDIKHYLEGFNNTRIPAASLGKNPPPLPELPDTAGLAQEDTKRDTNVPQARFTESVQVRRLSAALARVTSESGHYFGAPVDDTTVEGSEEPIGHSFAELKTTGKQHTDYNYEPSTDFVAEKDLDRNVSSLLRGSSDSMETELNCAKKELEGTRQIARTSDDRERQRTAVRKDLQSNGESSQPTNGQQGGNTHRSQPLQTEKSPPVGSLTDYLETGAYTKQSYDDRSRTTEESEIDRLLEEMEALKQENERLARESVDRDEDLAKAEIEIAELRSKAATAAALAAVTEGNIAKANDSNKPPRTSTTSVTTEMSESAMTNMVGRNFDIIREENDPWEEPDEEIGPAPIQVCLRLRPMTKLERNRRSRSCIEVHEGGRQFTVDSPLDGEYDFCFDHVFNIESSQNHVYETVGASLVGSLLQGINCAVLAYGLSGSGKTHTLTGKLPELADDRSENSSDDDSTSTDATPKEEDAGFLPRVISDLFHGMKAHPEYIEFRLTCSYVAIFLEKMFDLLDPKLDKTLLVTDLTYGITVEGAMEAFCFDEDDIIQLIRRGTACRKLIGSELNIDPNRSHAIFMLNIEQRHIRTGAVRRSYLQLAELAGFEVSSKAKGQSVQETKIIHKSFSALGNVIKCLTEGNPYAPYREAKLTSILKDAFGGNCRTTLFITASPSSYNISETINSIRLGQRVKRVTNKPRMNKDAGIEDYRKWLLQTEIKFGELSGLVQEFAKDLVKENQRDGNVQQGMSSSMWRTIQAIADEEESVHNPCRKALVLGEDEDQLQVLPKWRSLSIELTKRMPSDKLVEAVKARDRVESLLTDIQSESVVLRRQNELLVQEKRRKEEELSNAQVENREKALKNSELEHKLTLAESRSREAIHFLRYMRSLCWKLRKDTEKERPITVTEITANLAGAPDLSGLVDLDSLMVDAGLIENQEVDLDKVEGHFFDYLEEAGLVISGAIIEEDHDEIDELAGLDDGIDGDDGGNSRWVRRAAAPRPPARIPWDDQSIASRGTIGSYQNGDPTLFGLTMPWLNKKEEVIQEKYEPHASSSRYTRREQELRRDLQNMANKCVDLQVELNENKLLMGSLCNRVGDLQRKKLAQEAMALAKERDRMMHNAKAAAWKLQELHVVNKMLSKQSAETKQQVTCLEEGFQRLQESFRGTVQGGLDADAELRERAKNLQSIVDSLTGSADDEIEDEYNILNARVHLPIRGKIKPIIVDTKRVDPSSSDSQVHCLILKYKGKRTKKTPVASVHHSGKWHKKTRKTGTALIGLHREMLVRAFVLGKALTLPNWLDDEDYNSSDDLGDIDDLSVENGSQY